MPTPYDSLQTVQFFPYWLHYMVWQDFILLGIWTTVTMQNIIFFSFSFILSMPFHRKPINPWNLHVVCKNVPFHFFWVYGWIPSIVNTTYIWRCYSLDNTTFRMLFCICAELASTLRSRDRVYYAPQVRYNLLPCELLLSCWN